VDRLPEQITELQAGDLLAALSHDGTVYYLHPSFGGFFERVCMTPYRLGVNLHPYPTNVLDTLALKSGAIATNNDYWRSLENGPLAALPGLANRSQDAARIAAYYSHALDYWGVELQKMGTRRKLPSLLDDANVQFTNALRLNPSNLFARANQEVNAQLRKSPPAAPILGTSYLTAHFDKHWNVALSEFGPADSPDLDIQIGRFFAQHDDSMLAAPLFQRSLELAPGNTVSELDLINTYINLGLVNAALELIKRMRERSAGDPLELVGVEVQANLRRDDFAQADLLLSDAHRTNPKNDNFAAVAAEFYWIMGDKILREHKGDPAAENSAEKDAAVWFKKALSALDDQLQLLNARTAGTREISNVHRRRAELQMTLHDYPAAITTLTELVNQNPQDAVPLLSRAIAEQELGRLDAAKSDYQALEKMSQLPSSVVYFGLAQVAQKQNDKTAEIYYDKLYLQHAPANTLEFTNATRRLHELQGG
jgi:tetratricopeptide (TPR) repeat protein